MTNRDVVAEAMLSALSETCDEDVRRRLSVLVTVMITFCSKPETFPVFREYYASGYEPNDPESAEKTRNLPREAVSEMILPLLSLLDPKKARELIYDALEERR